MLCLIPTSPKSKSEQILPKMSLLSQTSYHPLQLASASAFPFHILSFFIGFAYQAPRLAHGLPHNVRWLHYKNNSLNEEDSNRWNQFLLWVSYLHISKLLSKLRQRTIKDQPGHKTALWNKKGIQLLNSIPWPRPVLYNLQYKVKNHWQAQKQDYD